MLGLGAPVVTVPVPVPVPVLAIHLVVPPADWTWGRPLCHRAALALALAVLPLSAFLGPAEMIPERGSRSRRRRRVTPRVVGAVVGDALIWMPR